MTQYVDFFWPHHTRDQSRSPDGCLTASRRKFQFPSLALKAPYNLVCQPFLCSDQSDPLVCLNHVFSDLCWWPFFCLECSLSSISRPVRRPHKRPHITVLLIRHYTRSHCIAIHLLRTCLVTSSWLSSSRVEFFSFLSLSRTNIPSVLFHKYSW